MTDHEPPYLDPDPKTPDEWGEEPYQEAAMWAYQFAGALTVEYDFREGDIVPLLDVLSALAEGRPPEVDWPAVVPSVRRRYTSDRAPMAVLYALAALGLLLIVGLVVWWKS